MTAADEASIRSSSAVEASSSPYCANRMIRDLASLMAPETPAFFCDHFVRKMRFHLNSVDRNRAAPLLPWPTINQLIEADSLPADRLHLYRDGNIVPPMMYRKSGENILRIGAFQDLLRQGSSVVMNGIERLVPAIGRLNAAIGRELSCVVGTNAYLSFGAGGALDAHYDLHDVLVLQVYGRKRWQSFGVAVPNPIEKHAPRQWTGRQVVWEDILEAGDVLYLPRGEIHAAAVQRDLSVHLTISLSTYRGVGFAKAILKQAAEDVICRQDIPLVAGEHAIARYEASLKAALHALIDRTGLSDLLDRDNRARPLRPLGNVGVSAPFQADMLVEPAVRRRIPLELDRGDRIEVSIGGKKFRLSGPARRVLDFLMWHNESPFDSIVAAMKAHFSEPLVQSAVEELAKQGLVGLRVCGADADDPGA